MLSCDLDESIQTELYGRPHGERYRYLSLYGRITYSLSPLTVRTEHGTHREPAVEDGTRP